MRTSTHSKVTPARANQFLTSSVLELLCCIHRGQFTPLTKGADVMHTVSFLKFYTAYAEDMTQSQPTGTGKAEISNKKPMAACDFGISRLAKFIAPADALSALKD